MIRRPHKRAVLKAVHLAIIPLFAWFVLVTPEDVLPFGRTAFLVHSNLALLFVILSLGWFAWYLRAGLMGRPGPKLGPRARRLHRVLHLTLIWGLLLVAFGGFVLGLTSTRLLKAGGFLPIAPPMGWERANEIAGLVHIYQFYGLGLIVLLHAGFHVWRHLALRDNALRIMAPKALHRWL
ncbi:MAG: cytochrome B [Paracoccaceae bacterium]